MSYSAVSSRAVAGFGDGTARFDCGVLGANPQDLPDEDTIFREASPTVPPHAVSLSCLVDAGVLQLTDVDDHTLRSLLLPARPSLLHLEFTAFQSHDIAHRRIGPTARIAERGLVRKACIARVSFDLDPVPPALRAAAIAAAASTAAKRNPRGGRLSLPNPWKSLFPRTHIQGAPPHPIDADLTRLTHGPLLPVAAHAPALRALLARRAAVGPHASALAQQSEAPPPHMEGNPALALAEALVAGGPVARSSTTRAADRQALVALVCAASAAAWPVETVRHAVASAGRSVVGLPVPSPRSASDPHDQVVEDAAILAATLCAGTLSESPANPYAPLPVAGSSPAAAALHARAEAALKKGVLAWPLSLAARGASADVVSAAAARVALAHGATALAGRPAAAACADASDPAIGPDPALAHADALRGDALEALGIGMESADQPLVAEVCAELVAVGRWRRGRVAACERSFSPDAALSHALGRGLAGGAAALEVFARRSCASATTGPPGNCPGQAVCGERRHSHSVPTQVEADQLPHLALWLADAATAALAAAHPALAARRPAARRPALDAALSAAADGWLQAAKPHVAPDTLLRCSTTLRRLTTAAAAHAARLAAAARQAVRDATLDVAWPALCAGLGPTDEYVRGFAPALARARRARPRMAQFVRPALRLQRQDVSAAEYAAEFPRVTSLLRSALEGCSCDNTPVWLSVEERLRRGAEAVRAANEPFQKLFSEPMAADDVIALFLCIIVSVGREDWAPAAVALDAMALTLFGSGGAEANFTSHALSACRALSEDYAT